LGLRCPNRSGSVAETFSVECNAWGAPLPLAVRQMRAEQDGLDQTTTQAKKPRKKKKKKDKNKEEVDEDVDAGEDDPELERWIEELADKARSPGERADLSKRIAERSADNAARGKVGDGVGEDDLDAMEAKDEMTQKKEEFHLKKKEIPNLRLAIKNLKAIPATCFTEANQAQIDLIQRDIDEINALGESVATPWQIKGRLKTASREANNARDAKKKIVDDAQLAIDENVKLIEKAQRENTELLEGMTQKKSDLAQAEQTASVSLQALNDHVGKTAKADEAKQSVDSTGGQSSNDPERVGTVLSAIGTLRTALMALLTRSQTNGTTQPRHR